MTINDLYKRDALDELKRTFSEIRSDSMVVDHGTAIEVYWGSERAVMDCSAETIHFRFLSVTCGRTPEPSEVTYQAMCKLLEPLFLSWGVQQVTAPVGTSKGLPTLQRYGGFSDPEDGMLTWNLGVPAGNQ